MAAFCEKQCGSRKAIDCCVDGETADGSSCVKLSVDFQDCVEDCNATWNEDRAQCRKQVDEYMRCGASTEWSCPLSSSVPVAKSCSVVPIWCCKDPSQPVCN